MLCTDATKPRKLAHKSHPCFCQSIAVPSGAAGQSRVRGASESIEVLAAGAEQSSLQGKVTYAFLFKMFQKKKSGSPMYVGRLAVPHFSGTGKETSVRQLQTLRIMRIELNQKCYSHPYI